MNIYELIIANMRSISSEDLKAIVVYGSFREHIKRKPKVKSYAINFFNSAVPPLDISSHKYSTFMIKPLRVRFF